MQAILRAKLVANEVRKKQYIIENIHAGFHESRRAQQSMVVHEAILVIRAIRAKIMSVQA